MTDQETPMTTDTRTAEITALIQPAPTIPAQLLPYVPPPQPQYLPTSAPGVPGVVVEEDGTTYYGLPRVVYNQPQLGNSPAVEQAVERIGKGVQLMGAGGFAAGAGFGVAEVVGAVAGAGVGTLVMVGAIAALSMMKAPRKVINNIREEHHYDQSILNVARPFGRAQGSITNANSKTVTNNT